MSRNIIRSMQVFSENNFNVLPILATICACSTFSGSHKRSGCKLFLEFNGEVELFNVLLYILVQRILPSGKYYGNVIFVSSFYFIPLNSEVDVYGLLQLK